MKGQKSGKCMTLCVLAWSSLQFALSDAIGSMAAFTGAGTIMRGFPRDFNNKTNMHSNVSGTIRIQHRPLTLQDGPGVGGEVSPNYTVG